MQGIRRILVGVNLALLDDVNGLDLTPDSKNAVELAFRTASQLQAELTLLHIIDEPAPEQSAILDNWTEVTAGAMQETCMKPLKPLIERARREGITAEALVGFGTPWLEMLRMVRDGRHDAVIVGTRNPGAAERLLFGSTAQKLMRNCPCPVWVTKSPLHLHDGPLTFLVPDDFSEVGLIALRMAISTARLIDARIHHLHVLKESFAAHVAMGRLTAAQQATIRENEMIWAREQLHRHLSQTDYRTVTHGVLPTILHGHPEEEIRKFIEEKEIDLLIMGTVGRSGMLGLVVGNTAERLIQTVQCALIAIKPPGFQCPVKLD